MLQQKRCLAAFTGTCRGSENRATMGFGVIASVITNQATVISILLQGVQFVQWQCGDWEKKVGQKKKKLYSEELDMAVWALSHHERIVNYTLSRWFENIKWQQLEGSKHIWLVQVSLVPRDLLYKSRIQFSGMKWGAKQLGRNCWFGTDRGSFSLQRIPSPYLSTHHDGSFLFYFSLNSYVAT